MVLFARYMVIEVEIFSEEDNAQARYLVRGYDDVYWSDDIDLVVDVVRQELERIADEDGKDSY